MRSAGFVCQKLRCVPAHAWPKNAIVFPELLVSLFSDMSKVTDSISAARLSRRQFIQRSAITAAGLTLFGGVRSSFGKISANEKLNIGVVGTANRAASDI